MRQMLHLLTLSLVIVVCNTYHDVCSPTTFVKTLFTCRCANFDAEAASTLFYRIQGRLGNHVLGFAMLLALKRRIGLNVYLEAKIKKSIERYFGEGATAAIPALEDALCADVLEDPKVPWQSYLWSANILEREDHKTGLMLELPVKMRLMGENLNTVGFTGYMESVVPELKQTLILREFFRNEAQKRLSKVADDFRSRKKKKKKKRKGSLTFVGVHVRKTDFDALVVKAYNMPPLTPSYYFKAIDLYRDGEFENPVFVIVTDDHKWVQDNIVPKAERTSVPVFVVGQDGSPNDEFAIGTDLATLAACNHTVLSYGTFSFWSGFLSSGLRVIPPMIVGDMNPGRSRLRLWNERLPVMALPDHGLYYKSDEQIKKETF